MGLTATSADQILALTGARTGGAAGTGRAGGGFGQGPAARAVRQWPSPPPPSSIQLSVPHGGEPCIRGCGSQMAHQWPARPGSPR